MSIRPFAANAPSGGWCRGVRASGLQARPLGDGASARPHWFPSRRAAASPRVGALLWPAGRRVLPRLPGPDEIAYQPFHDRIAWRSLVSGLQLRSGCNLPVHLAERSPRIRLRRQATCSFLHDLVVGCEISNSEVVCNSGLTSTADRSHGTKAARCRNCVFAGQISTPCPAVDTTVVADI